MFGRRRGEDPKLAIERIAPWYGAGLEIRPVVIEARRPGLGLRMSAGAVSSDVVSFGAVEFWAGEVRAVAVGKQAIAESRGSEPIVFLARVDAAAPSSAMAPLVDGLAPADIALLAGGPKPERWAVIAGATLADFQRWAEQLPG